jgi:hypothetical protein
MPHNAGTKLVMVCALGALLAGAAVLGSLCLSNSSLPVVAEKARHTSEGVTPTLYLPVVTAERRSVVTHITVPVTTNWTLIAAGETLTNALGGSEIPYAYQDEMTLSTVNCGQDAFYISGEDRYLVQRDYISFDLSAVPEGEIVEAQLELAAYMAYAVEGEFDLKFHRGRWEPPPDEQSWDAYEDRLGTYDTGMYDGGATVRIPLPGLVGKETPFSSDLHMTVRGDEETQLVAEKIGVHFALKHPLEEYQMSFLHVEVRED